MSVLKVCIIDSLLFARYARSNQSREFELTVDPEFSEIPTQATTAILSCVSILAEAVSWHKETAKTGIV